jgi:hypothetical protein
MLCFLEKRKAFFMEFELITRLDAHREQAVAGAIAALGFFGCPMVFDHLSGFSLGGPGEFGLPLLRILFSTALRISTATSINYTSDIRCKASCRGFLTRPFDVQSSSLLARQNYA